MWCAGFYYSHTYEKHARLKILLLQKCRPLFDSYFFKWQVGENETNNANAELPYASHGEHELQKEHELQEEWIAQGNASMASMYGTSCCWIWVIDKIPEPHHWVSSRKRLCYNLKNVIMLRLLLHKMFFLWQAKKGGDTAMSYLPWWTRILNYPFWL
jgi:hypothetical protein